VFTITDGGYAKRTRVTEYRLQGRGGIGIKAMKMVDDRGSLVGALAQDSHTLIAGRGRGGMRGNLPPGGATGA
jgi:DNA gyrase subunit A